MICQFQFVIRDLARLNFARCVVSGAIALAFVVGGLSPAVRADTLLRWKFAEGQRLRVIVDQHTVTETTGAGKPTGIDIMMQLRMTWTIDSVDPSGTAQMTQRFERFEVAMKSEAGEPIEYASDSGTKSRGAAADIAAAIEPVIGADFNVTMTDRGAIRDVKLSDAAAQAFAAVESPALKQLFSAGGISQLLRQAAVEFPEQAIAADGNWGVTLTTPSPLGKITQGRTYTLSAPGDLDGTPVERINITGELELESDEKASNRLKLVGQSLSGTMFFDAVSGRLMKSQATQKLSTERPYREFIIKVDTTATTTTTISPL